ncbi:hypothetical protein HUG10_19420 (plasmid) [Halorarum halophilum]|uniref:Uncharacterized protein n=1 Tax=Halorarum halophilum TaxID=2743090 RepID=A0A7D5KAC1_9EURY|nr:DUF5821 family protein [Halobaculum halophilum]QLG29774.1 hypothetical protein HUG10_19420 [Halobaculum halophilum]
MTPATDTGSVRRLLRDPIGSTDEVIVVSDHVTVLREAVLVVAEADEDAPDHVRLLGTEGALSRACDDFLAASRAADLVEEERLSMRVSEQGHLPSLVITGGEGGDPNRQSAAGEVEDPSRHSDSGEVTTISPLPGNDAVAVRTDEADPVATIRSAFARSFSDAAEYEVGVPGYTRLLESLDVAVGPAVREDVASVMEAGVTVRSSADGVDEIDTILLVGGRNGAQLFELSEWAEDLGVASRATMSSRKRQLEAAGLLTTEKIRADVGRPRQRLLVAPEELRDSPPADLIRGARDALVDE